MRKEYRLSDAKFVHTKNELGYQEVLDDFKNAEEIIIVTYNISEKQSYLIQELANTSPEAKINIFTNIPSRWETYYGDTYKNTARKKINVYLNKLKPDSIGDRVHVLFNFENHGKIVMTNNVAYIGSANYSEESKNNIEFGIISRDPGFIEFLRKETREELEKTSTPYFEYDYLPLLLEINMHLTNLFVFREELFDQIYLDYDDLDGKGYFYNDIDKSLSQTTIDSIIRELDECLGLFGGICDIADQLTNDGTILEELGSLYESSALLKSQFEDRIISEEVYELAGFDFSKRANDIIEVEYSAEAYDEYLDSYFREAMDRVYEEFQDLCQEVKDDLNRAIEIIDEYLDLSKKALNKFEELEFRKTSENIDNT